MENRIHAGADCYIDDNTPIKEVRGLLKYFLTECRSETGCEWQLAQHLLNRSDFLAEDFIAVALHFDGQSFSDDMNSRIIYFMSERWSVLKVKSITNEDLVSIVLLRFETISDDAWNTMTARKFSTNDCLRMMIFGELKYVVPAFNRLGRNVIDLGEHEIALMVRKIAGTVIADEVRKAYFEVIKRQQFVIQNFGEVELKEIPINYGQKFDYRTRKEFHVITKDGARLAGICFHS